MYFLIRAKNNIAFSGYDPGAMIFSWTLNPLIITRREGNMIEKNFAPFGCVFYKYYSIESDTSNKTNHDVWVTFLTI